MNELDKWREGKINSHVPYSRHVTLFVSRASFVIYDLYEF